MRIFVFELLQSLKACISIGLLTHLRVMIPHSTIVYIYIYEVNEFDLFFHLVQFSKCFVLVVASKIDAENIFPHFLAIFALF